MTHRAWASLVLALALTACSSNPGVAPLDDAPVADDEAADDDDAPGDDVAGKTPRADAGKKDGGVKDAGRDSAAKDAGKDAGGKDASDDARGDTGVPDAGANDAAPVDPGNDATVPVDAGVSDATIPDAEPLDAEVPDAPAPLDAAPEDAIAPDAASPVDGGQPGDPTGARGVDALCEAACNRAASCYAAANNGTTVDVPTCVGACETNNENGPLALYRRDVMSQFVTCVGSADCASAMNDTSAATCQKSLQASTPASSTVYSLCQTFNSSPCENADTCLTTFNVLSDPTAQAAAACVQGTDCNAHATCLKAVLRQK